jgi:hypothetical protein
MFPNLYKLACKYLIIPATSSPSERVFSVSGQVISERRSRLSGEHVNQIVTLYYDRNRKD